MPVNSKPKHLLANVEGENSLTFLAAIIDAVVDPIFVKDRSHRWVLFNNAFCNLIGRSYEELIGRSDYDFFPKEQAEIFWAKDEEVFASVVPIENKENLTDSNGNILVISTKKSIFKTTEGETFLVGVIRDITDIERAQAYINIQADELRIQAEELSTERDSARQASNVKGQFLANMSHEIRTPMNGVLGITNLLLESPLTTEQYELANLVKKSGEHLLTVINDILDFSKIEAGKLELAQVSFSPRHLLADIERLSIFMVQEKSLVIAIDVAADVPQYLIGDPDRLKQILTNLIGNAIKFTADNGAIVITAELESKSDSACSVRFAVIDSGIGIPIDKQKKIFEAFTQADPSTTRKYGGTGLGLSISAKLAELMGGELKVRSQAGLGSVFFFSAWFEIAPTIELPCPPVIAHESYAHASSLKILLAEDHEINQLLVVSILKKAGNTVVVAGNGEEAITLFNRDEFDIILMDIQMPILSGEETTSIIRKSPKGADIPIIALTANCMTGDKERYLALGMNGYVGKPFKRAELLGEIERLYIKPAEDSRSTS